ncbi:MAG: right-handed parallel beta-helix repeat-containing protein [Lentisphaerae bacterium]|nr:right-handed parallel beta-helix repeat-containing protein [Lentisphaerota bacterium]
MTTGARLGAVLLLAVPAIGLGRTLHVDRNHPAAANANPGTEQEPLLTIQRAADLAQPGDTIRIHTGVYRETVQPPRGGAAGQPIVYQGDPEGGTVIRGSVAWPAQWSTSDAHAGYTAPIDFLLDADYNPYALALNVCNNYRALPVRPVTSDTQTVVATTGQLFVNAEPYRQVAAVSDLVPQTWMVARDGEHIHLRMPDGASPDDARIEVTTRKHLFMPQHRGFGYIHLRHLVFEHGSPPGPFPQRGMVSTRTGHHWVIEHCVFAHSMTVGLDCGREGYAKTFAGVYDSEEYERDNNETRFEAHGHIVRYNRFAHNGVCGLAVYRIRNAIFYGNTFENNAYILQFAAPGRKQSDAYRTGRMCWNEYGGFKSHGFRDSVLVGNLFTGNYRGLFLDTEFNGALVSANVFLRNHANSLILERCWTDDAQTYVINNIFIENSENDVRTMDLSRTTLAHNLFIKNRELTDYDLEYYDLNRSAPVYFQFNYRPGIRRTSRPTYRISVLGNRVLNNVFLRQTATAIVLPPDDLPDPLRPYYRDNRFDYNVIDAPQFGIHRYAFYDTIRRRITGLREVGFDVWRNEMGNGTHSTVYDPGTLGTIRALDGPAIELDLKEAFFALETEDIPRRRTDFFGKPVPRGASLPGPFIDLKPGKQRLAVWPVPVDDARVETLIREERIQELL